MIKRAIFSIAVLILLCACGYRGALTLPDPPQQNSDQSSTSQEEP